MILWILDQPNGRTALDHTEKHAEPEQKRHQIGNYACHIGLDLSQFR